MRGRDKIACLPELVRKVLKSATVVDILDLRLCYRFYEFHVNEIDFQYECVMSRREKYFATANLLAMLCHQKYA